ncbi:RNA polymerase sigma factor [Pedococcus sp. 5OH_020]|uniref:RNA polymerase sigma factor n=1 Tax=Pedococcus sp. 5OH_020 TaxID=2989814 RepID=UPI0022E9FC02|nr:sigma-70 family RNA polymerase sigma factor [Pedococcus sp. 5OH_020]
MAENATSDRADEASVRRLILDCRAGDAQAFARLYSGHVPHVRRYALRLSRREQAADDLVAEAFTNTWQQLCLGRGPEVAFLAYLRATVLNLHLRQLRRDELFRWVADVEKATAADPDAAALVAERSAEDGVLEQLLNDQLLSALRTLPRRWQEILALVYLENQPYPRVASRLGLTIPATRQLAHRARLGMRVALDAQGTSGWTAA